MSDRMDREQIYSLVRKRLGRDATRDMIESVSGKVESLLAREESAPVEPLSGQPSSSEKMILTATGLDSPDAAADIMAQLQSYKCRVLGADRATADGYFSLLVSFDPSASTLSMDELTAALEVAAAVDGLEISLKKAPVAPESAEPVTAAPDGAATADEPGDA